MEDPLERCSQLDACYQLEGKTNIYLQRYKYVGRLCIIQCAWNFCIFGVIFCSLAAPVRPLLKFLIQLKKTKTSVSFSTRQSIKSVHCFTKTLMKSFSNWSQFVEGTFISTTTAKRRTGERAF